MGQVYPNAPLALVVLEIRIPEVGLSKAVQGSLAKLLRSELPLTDNMTESQMTIGPGQSHVQQIELLRFRTRDQVTAVALHSRALLVQTTNYGGYSESFRPLIQTACEVVESVVQPTGFERVGLRYIDEIRIPGVLVHPGDWSGWIDPHLLAAVADEFLPDNVIPTLWQGVVQYKTGSDSTLQVLYGPQEGQAVPDAGFTRRPRKPQPGLFFLLDSDSYWEPSDYVPEFTTTEILTRCDALHAPVSAMFNRMVTEDLKAKVFMKDEGL